MHLALNQIKHFHINQPHRIFDPGCIIQNPFVSRPFISEITLIETGAAITRRTKDIPRSREFVENLINFPNMIILPITSSVVETALDLGIEKGLRAGDCIQVATALVHDIELFVERDRDFQRAKDLLEILSPEDVNQKIEATLE